jgi:hypothetical protein
MYIYNLRPPLMDGAIKGVTPKKGRFGADFYEWPEKNL